MIHRRRLEGPDSVALRLVPLVLCAGLVVGLWAGNARAGDDAMDADHVNAMLREKLEGGGPAAPGQAAGKPDRPYLVSGEITSEQIQALLRQQIEQTDDTKVSLGKPTTSIGLDIRFAKNSSSLTPQAKADLCEVGDSLNEAEFARMHFELGGHADSDGTDAINAVISKDRAEAARAYLTTACGVDPSRIVATGYGSSDPLVEERGLEANKRKNRRVDLRMLRDE